MAFYSIPLAILAVVLAALALLLFTPVVVLVDSRSRELRVRWTFLLSYAGPLPGGRMGRELSVAGVSVALPQPKRERPSKSESKFGPGHSEGKQRQRRTKRFLRNCLLDGRIRSVLFRLLRRLPASLLRAVEVSRLHCEVSLPDPALNGMLWGVLAGVDAASHPWLRCNFTGRNAVRAKVSIFPHRVIKAILLFFFERPYRTLLQQWRAS